MTIHLRQKQEKLTHIFVDSNIPDTNTRYKQAGHLAWFDNGFVFEKLVFNRKITHF